MLYFTDEDYPTVEEFFRNCSAHEKQRLRNLLNNSHYGMCVSEHLFEKHLSSLHGRWNQLTKEEEDIIINISKKFVL